MISTVFIDENNNDKIWYNKLFSNFVVAITIKIFFIICCNVFNCAFLTWNSKYFYTILTIRFESRTSFSNVIFKRVKSLYKDVCYWLNNDIDCSLSLKSREEFCSNDDVINMSKTTFMISENNWAIYVIM